MSADETGALGAGEIDEPVEEMPAASVPPSHTHEAHDGDDPRGPSHWRIDEARRRRLRPWAIVGAVLVVLVTGGVALSYTSMFGARVIEVEGAERLAPRRVMRLAGLELGSNVVHLDATSTEARLETDPWILDATVETSLPGTITISVRERRPVLLLAGPDGDRRLVAGDGTVLGHAPWATDLPEVAAAPGATLDEATLGIAGEVVQAMAPTLRSSVDTVTLAADRTVSLVLDGEVEVRFGSVAEAAAKGRALRGIMAYADEQGRGLLSVDVSSPAAPTARFVGSQQPTSVPDPSADVPSEDESADGVGGAAPSSSSPSSPPSPSP